MYKYIYLYQNIYLYQDTYYLSAYYLIPISSLYRCTTVFYRRTASLYRIAANIVISKTGIYNPILSLRLFQVHLQMLPNQ